MYTVNQDEIYGKYGTTLGEVITARDSRCSSIGEDQRDTMHMRDPADLIAHIEGGVMQSRVERKGNIAGLDKILKICQYLREGLELPE